MSAIKSYCKQEFKLQMFKVEHQKKTDFYISNWQTTKSVVPLLIFRVVLFLASLIIVLSSIITYGIYGHFKFWFIYLTHWGLCSMLLTTGFGVAVSARVYLQGPISVEFKLPWYVQAFWVLYNIATPIAFMITIFYWTVLHNAGIEEEVNHALDVAIHGINSVIMFLLLVSAALPSRLLHVYQPMVFGFVYMLFGLFYHIAGGKDQLGNAYIYPVVDWSNPGTTILVVFGTTILLIVLHCFTMALAAIRDTITTRWIQKPNPVQTEEGVPLRQQTQLNV